MITLPTAILLLSLSTATNLTEEPAPAPQAVAKTNTAPALKPITPLQSAHANLVKRVYTLRARLAKVNDEMRHTLELNRRRSAAGQKEDHNRVRQLSTVQQQFNQQIAAHQVQRLEMERAMKLQKLTPLAATMDQEASSGLNRYGQ